jgi:hypothetical protein
MTNKLSKWWDSKPELFRKGFTWAIVLQVIYNLLCVFDNNIGFPTQQIAKIMGYVEKGFLALVIIAVVVAIVGLFSSGYKARYSKQDEAVEIAKGVWMVKK